MAPLTPQNRAKTPHWGKESFRQIPQCFRVVRGGAKMTLAEMADLYRQGS